jgi:hypothetical protein
MKQYVISSVYIKQIVINIFNYMTNYNYKHCFQNSKNFNIDTITYWFDKHKIIKSGILI